MEQKLKEFKRRRRREIVLNKPKEFVQGLVNKIFPKEDFPSNCSNANDTSSGLPSSLKNSCVHKEDETSSSSVGSDDVSSSSEPAFWTVLIKLLYFALWVITFLIAVQLKFGLAYIILSVLVFTCI